MTRTRRPGVRLLVAGAVLALGSISVQVTGADPPSGLPALGVTVVSSTPAMVSGGDALIRVQIPPEVDPTTVVVARNGEDVTGRFASGPDGWLGLVDGLVPGTNTIAASSVLAEPASLEVVNSPIAGPIVSGPHQVPYVCTAAAELGPLDADCQAAAPVIKWRYRSTSGSMRPLADRSVVPADAARTTLSDGTSVPYVVRMETGTINRGVYRIAVLDPPERPWNPATWNRRLDYLFTGGCGEGHSQGMLDPDAMFARDQALAKGYAMVSSSLNAFTTSCNDLLAGETASMVKEYFVERYGVPLITIGRGMAGGAMQVQLVAQNFPGVLDAAVVWDSFPDLFTLLPGLTDCRLLGRFFAALGPSKWTNKAQAAVTGYVATQTCQTWDTSWTQLIQPSIGCPPELPSQTVYDATTNPTGVRCTVHDNMAAVFGVDPASGFARRPLDNVGVQYGLTALAARTITVDQFLDLNERIGGYDADGNVVPARTVASADAVSAATTTGRVVTGGLGLAGIPLIDTGVYVDASRDIHQRFWAFAVRERLRATGASGTQAIWTVAPKEGSQPPDPRLAAALDAIDRWATAVAADHTPGTPSEKVARNRPAEAADSCWDAQGRLFRGDTVYAPGSSCAALYPVHGDPRTAAGAPLRDDVLICTRVPPSPTGYGVPFTAAQAARLPAIFPDGVCAYDGSLSPPPPPPPPPPEAQFVLLVTRAGIGTGTVTSNAGGISCGADCSELYDAGRVITLSAKPAKGSKLAAWSGACSGTGTCVLTMDQAHSVTATFARP
jgi:hypothetical protein